MITKRMCLVLGAGASAPYGFPTGSELMQQSKQMPDEWWTLAHELLGTTKDTHDEFIRELDQSGAESLDEFAGKHPHYKDYAKALIAYRIGDCERQGRILKTERSIDWLNFLVRRLVDGPTLSELANVELSFVTFNFDRSLEEGLLLRLSSTYRNAGELDAAIRTRVVDAISKWKIIHVHGDLGELREFASGGEGRTYEKHAAPQAIQLAMQRIILLNDAQEASPEFQSARLLIRDAQFVLFLGFGFHRLNCTRVIPEKWTADHPTVYCTTQNMKTGRVNKAVSYFKGVSPQMRSVDSVELLLELESHFSN
jgi:hypothetical protein